MNHWPIVLVCLLATGASAADNCDALRSEIDTRMRAGGLAGFSLAVLDTEQTSPAKVVGSCAMGRRKIVYLPAGPAAPAPASPAAVPVLTECRDGSTPADGRCTR